MTQKRLLFPGQKNWMFRHFNFILQQQQLLLNKRDGKSCMGGHEKRWWSLNNFEECSMRGAVKMYLLWLLLRRRLESRSGLMTPWHHTKCCFWAGYLFVYSNCLSIFKYHEEAGVGAGLPLARHTVVEKCPKSPLSRKVVKWDLWYTSFWHCAVFGPLDGVLATHNDFFTRLRCLDLEEAASTTRCFMSHVRHFAVIPSPPMRCYFKPGPDFRRRCISSPISA